jgi:hypothetical protein
MHFNVYGTFYLLYSQQHVSAAIAAIFRVQMWMYLSILVIITSS